MRRVVPVGGRHWSSGSRTPSPVASGASGRALGAELPDRITVVTVEAERLDTFDEALRPAVAAAIWPAADAVLATLAGRNPDLRPGR